MTSKRAFTLIELLIVIVIIVVVSAVAVPAYARFWDRTRFETAAEQIQDQFAYAREQAIANDVDVDVSVSPISNSISMANTAAPPVNDAPVALVAEQRRGPAPHELQLSDTVHIVSVSSASGDGGTIRFRGDGTADSAEIALTGDAGYSAVIEVRASDGRSTVQMTTGSEK